MIKHGNLSTSLINWYLAKLRVNANQNLDWKKKTPITLVETDTSLIKELVQKVEPERSTKEAKIYELVKQEHKIIHKWESAILWIAVIGSLGFTAAYFFP